MDDTDNTMYYKYRSCLPRTWDLIKNHEVYFSLPGSLNDPLDVSIDIKSEYERGKSHVYDTDTHPHPEGRRSFLITILDCLTKGVTKEGEDVSLSHALDLFMQSRGGLSLSKVAHEALLWSHYADGHRGLCLGFNAEILQVDGVTSSGGVQYLPSPPYMEKFLELTDEFGTFCQPWDGVQFSDEQGKKLLQRESRHNVAAKDFYKV